LNDTRSASLCRGTMPKSNTCICSPSVELKLLSRNCLYFLIHPHTLNVCYVQKFDSWRTEISSKDSLANLYSIYFIYIRWESFRYSRKSPPSFNRKVHYRVHKRSSPVSTLNQTNAANTMFLYNIVFV
jgi:hypothetical protein